MTDSIHKQHVRAFDTHGRLHTESRLNIPMHYITRTYAHARTRCVLHDTISRAARWRERSEFIVSSNYLIWANLDQNVISNKPNVKYVYKKTDWKQPKHIILSLLIYRIIELDLLLLELLDILYRILEHNRTRRTQMGLQFSQIFVLLY